MPSDLRELTRSVFEPLLQQAFRVRLESDDDDQAALELTLVEVKSLGPAPTPELREPFSLLFHGPSDRMLEQGTYTLDHPHLGAPAIFVVPLARTAQRATYQAIFA